MEDRYFQIFKNLLHDFITEEYDPCKDFKTGILNANNAKDLKKHFDRNNDEIFDYFGGNFNVEDSEEYQKLKWKYDNATDDIVKLEEQLGDFEFIKGSSLNDEFKLNHFLKYKNDYTESEIEDLLKHGKIYLK